MGANVVYTHDFALTKSTTYNSKPSNSRGLPKPRRMKRYTRVMEKIRRLRQQYRSVSSQYDIEVKPDTKGHKAIAVEWQRNGKHEERERNAGAWLLRTSLTQ